MSKGQIIKNKDCIACIDNFVSLVSVEVLWVAIASRLAGAYGRFGGTCRLSFKGNNYVQLGQ